MRAARYTDFGGDITIVDVRDPEPPSGGVVVRVEATGVCRSDWHGWQGHDADISLPHVPGHEFAGTVTAVGRDVTTVAVGQRIAVPFILGCGACAECRMGDTQLCRDQVQPGFHLDGSFAELVAVPRADVNVAVIPDGVSVAAAASLGCRYATAWRAIVERAGVGAGDRIVVFGCGGVGLAAVQIAVAHPPRSPQSTRRRSLATARSPAAQDTPRPTPPSFRGRRSTSPSMPSATPR
jgi:alcohol dehydrogenase